MKDDDPANVFGAVAEIDVEKAINAVDPAHPTVAEDADDPEHPVVLNLGTPVTYTYLLSNAGNGPIDGELDPRRRRHAGLTRRTTSRRRPCSVGGFNIGDLNRNNLLDVGEVWRYTSAGTPAGDGGWRSWGCTRTRSPPSAPTAAPARTTTDTDAASYLGQAGAIRVVKAINASHPPIRRATRTPMSPTGPILQVGSPIVWTYQVFNQSGVALDIVDLTRLRRLHADIRQRRHER